MSESPAHLALLGVNTRYHYIRGNAYRAQATLEIHKGKGQNTQSNSRETRAY